jgi:hypothetical protein
LYWSQLSVFLFDEEEWSRELAFGLGDVSLVEVFLEERCQCLLFWLGQGVHLPWHMLWVAWFQFYGVIPFSWWWESL